MKATIFCWALSVALLQCISANEFEEFVLMKYDRERHEMVTNVKEGLVGARIYNGSHFVTGTVCDDLMDDHTADFVCRQIGFVGSDAWGNQGDLDSNDQFVPIHLLDSISIALDDLSCPKDANNFTECYHKDFFDENCDHNEDVWVRCSNESRPHAQYEFVQFSLMSYDNDSNILNFNDSSGLVMVTYKNMTGSNDSSTLVGTLCADGFNESSAHFICRNIGYDYADYWDYNYDYQFIPQTFIESLGMDVALDEFSCQEGNYTTSEECTWNFNNNSCGHQNDVIIICENNTGPTVSPTNGTIPWTGTSSEPTDNSTNDTDPTASPTNGTNPWTGTSSEPTDESTNGLDISFGGINLNLNMKGVTYNFGWRWPW